MSTVAFHNLGCKVNSYETQAMLEIMVKEGFDIVSFDDVADVYVINTCSVTNIADRKSRQIIHRARKNNPDACVVATGCYVQGLSDDERKEIGADIVIGNNRKGEIAGLVEQFFSNKDTKDTWEDVNDNHVCYENLMISRDEEHTRCFVKVQDGCNMYCSYCKIPYVRGRIRSRAIESCVEEITKLVQNGYKECVLTGIHLTSYGTGTEYSLIDLIEKVASIEGLERIRLGSLEPQIITLDFVERLSKIDKFCPHFHLSLQSGCDDTLKRMNRHYSAEQYLHATKLIKQYFTHPAFTTDVIVGFPGETDEEFDTTEKFVEEVGFYEIHVFPYSKRKGTKAEKMPHQIRGDVKKERADKLIKRASKLKENYLNELVNNSVDVLIEETRVVNGKTYFTGFTSEYVRCYVEKGEQNVISKGVVDSLFEDGVLLK